MPTAVNSGYQALTPGVPTLHASSNPSVRERPTSPPSSALPHFYGLDYFLNRLESLGLNQKTAKEHGLEVDGHGNILQLVRRFDGSHIKFIPKELRKKWDTIQKRKTLYNFHEESFYRLLAVTRFHPGYLKDNPWCSKYWNQPGEKVRPLPTKLAIDAFNNKTTGGTIAFNEGYFKSLALSLAGLEAVAFTGITVFRLNHDLRQYLIQRLPDRILIIYDADALEIAGSSPKFSPKPARKELTQSQQPSPKSSPKPVREGLAPSRIPAPSSKPAASPSLETEGLSSRRNEDFNRSATNFSNELFALFDFINHNCEIVFVMGKPAMSPPFGGPGGTNQGAAAGAEEVKEAEHPKGIDDLIAQHGSEAVIKDLTTFNFTPTFRHSKFFAGFTLAKSSNHRKLKKLFLKDDFRAWAEVHAGSNFNLLAEGFRYRSALYQANSHGDLYDESVTYHLLTDPFRVDLPTDYLTVKNYLDDQKNALSNLLEKHQRLAIQGPTGCGKTSFFTNLAKKTKKRMVIAVPTVNLADQIARKAKGYALTGNRDIAKIQKANDSLLVVCTYDTLHQLPDLWRRILVFDEAHNLVNQYGQVYNGFKPFRAETLRNCVRLFDEARQTILLSGTMSPILCRALEFHLVTVRRLINPSIRVFDIEASATTNTALAKSLLTRLIKLFPKQAATSPASATPPTSPLPDEPMSHTEFQLTDDPPTLSYDYPPKSIILAQNHNQKVTPPPWGGAGGEGSKCSQNLNKELSSTEKKPGEKTRAPRANNSGSLKAKRLTSKSSEAASKQFVLGKLHVVFWNNTNQIEKLKNTLIKLGYLKAEEIAIISRTHYDSGDSPELDDIISQQKIKPGIRLLLCTCLISEGVNINNTNVGRIFTVGLRCEDTFRQFIARFRKLKSVNVFSILDAERDLSPYFFPSAEIELRENMERAQLQAKHLRQRQNEWHGDYDEHELPFLDQIEQAQKKYSYRPQLLNLVYREEDWYADPLHVLAAIRGRKLATSNNCYFYSRLRDLGFNVLTVEPTDPDPDVEESIDNQNKDDKTATKNFRTNLRNDLQNDPAEAINALDLWYQETKNRHGRQTLRNLCPNLLDEDDGASGLHYLTTNRAHFDEYTRRRILRRAKLHALGVDDVATYLAMSDTDFNHEYRAALAHFEQTLFNDPEHRKLMQPAHKEEVRIKQHIVAHLSPPPSPNATSPQYSGEALVNTLAPLLTVTRTKPLLPRTGGACPLPPDHSQASPPPNRASRQPPSNPYTIDILGLTPTRAINLIRQLLHTTVAGSGIHRTITIGEAYTPANPPPLAARSKSLLKTPLRLLEIMDS